MGSIPKEYYSRVYELIDNFINGTNAPGEIKPLSNNKRAKGIFELKDDQVRIVFKHIKDNIYNIIGAFAKKTITTQLCIKQCLVECCQMLVLKKNYLNN